MKKCKDCVYNYKDGNRYFCSSEGYETTNTQNECKGCEYFEPSYKSKEVEND